MTKKKIDSIKKTFQALTFVKEAGEGGIRPAAFARLMWPDSPCWNNERRCGKTGTAKGMGMFCAAGQYLGTLAKKKGLTEKQEKSYFLTEAGEAFLQDEDNLRIATMAALDETGPTEVEAPAEDVTAEDATPAAV